MKTNNNSQTPQLISNDDIFNAARQLRNEDNEALSMPAEMPTAKGSEMAGAVGSETAKVQTLHSKHRWWAAAACLTGFLAGFGVNEGITRSSGVAETPPVVQNIVQLDTILLHETIRDTVFQTRIVVREIPSKSMVAQASPTSSTATEELPDKPEGVGCSMLCDDIPYELLAGNGRNENW